MFTLFALDTTLSLCSPAFIQRHQQASSYDPQERCFLPEVARLDWLFTSFGSRTIIWEV